MSETSRPPIRAGKAFVWANRNNPELASKLEDLKRRFKAFHRGLAKLREMGYDPTMKNALEGAKKKVEAEFDKIWENEYGIPYPKNVNEWANLCGELGVPLDQLFDQDSIQSDYLEDWIEGRLKEMARERDGGGEPFQEPLSERQQEACDFILGSGEPVSAQEIAIHLGCGESTVTTHIIPALKIKRGLKNKRSRGYYFPNQ